MPIRARVGRHTRQGGRQCQNWPDDQRTVKELLFRIPKSKGGMMGSTNEPVVSGICSDLLYASIKVFEAHQFPQSNDGFVEPGGTMLKRMEDLAGVGEANNQEKTKDAAENVFDTLRRNLLDDSMVKGVWTAGEQVAFDNLVKMAVNHVDVLKARGFDKLPWRVELFGIAYTTVHDPRPYVAVPDEGLTGPFTAVFKDPKLLFQDPDDIGKTQGEWTDPPPIPNMRYGHPVDISRYITTADHGALLLYDTGDCIRVRRYHSGKIDIPARLAHDKEYIQGMIAPILGAKRAGFIT